MKLCIFVTNKLVSEKEEGVPSIPLDNFPQLAPVKNKKGRADRTTERAG